MSQGFNSHLGLEPGPDDHSVSLTTRPEHEAAPGILHFAVLATVAEVSAARAVARPVVPAALSLQLLHRAAPGHLVGRGRVLKRGRRLAVAEGEVAQNGRVVAKATITFALV